MRKILVVLSLLLFAFSNAAKAEPAWASGEVSFSPVEHIVLKGEVLSRIATRFAVPMKLILLSRFNPALAKRNNPDLIYAGETIVIPLPAVLKSMLSENVRTPAIAYKVAIHQGKTALPKMVVTKVPNVNASVTPAILGTLSAMTGLSVRNLVAAGFCVSAALSILFLWLGVSLYRKKATNAKPDQKQEIELTPRDLTPEGILEVLGNARAGNLALAMKMPIAVDERGNSVLLGNIAAFVQHEKRRGLQESLIKDLTRDLKLEWGKSAPVVGIRGGVSGIATATA